MADGEFNRRAEDRNAFERHFQTGVGALIIALVLWVGTTLTTNQKTLATLEVNMNNLKEKVIEIKSQISHQSDTYVLKNEFESVKSQCQSDIKRLETTVSTLEEKHRQ
jgi:uncharacterized protein YycO